MLVCVWVGGGDPGGDGGAAQVRGDSKKVRRQSDFHKERQVRWLTLRTTKQGKMIKHKCRTAAFSAFLQHNRCDIVWQGTGLDYYQHHRHHLTETLRGWMQILDAFIQIGTHEWWGQHHWPKEDTLLHNKEHLYVNSGILLPDDQKQDRRYS